MNEKLIVKNFGPIRDAELELKKTTVFIGPQGSGKSTLAKVITAFVNNEYAQVTERVTNPQPSIGIPFIEHGLADFLSDDTVISFLTGETHFLYNKSFSISSMNNKNYVSSIKENLFIPAERVFIASISNSLYGLMSSRINLPKSLLVFGSRFEFSIDILERFQTLLNVEFFRGKERKPMLKLTNGKEISLSESSSGHQAMIPLQITIEAELIKYSNKTSTLFTIEEPELNLYPTTQKQLIYYLADRCTKFQNEMLITTHSPYVLTSLNLLLLAYRVWRKHPEREEEISQIVPRESWLNPDEFAAYYVADGTVRSIIGKNTGLISENELDDVSEDFAGEQDMLMQIYRQPVHEATN